MGQIKWYKRDPDAALEGMRELSLEERGAYNTILDLIYVRDGNLPDDDRFIAGWLGVDMRVWRRIKKSLIQRGKLYIADGQIRNSRADAVVLEALARVVSAADAGRASAARKVAKSKGISNKNSDMASTTVGTDDVTGVQQIKIENKKDIPNGISPPPSPSTKKQAAKNPDDSQQRQGGPTLLPHDFEPRLGPKTQAMVDKWPEHLLEQQIVAFEGHARANARTALDWQAALQTWLSKTDQKLQKELRDEQRRADEAGSTGNSMVDAVLARERRRAAQGRG